MPTTGSSGPNSTSLIRRAQGGDHAALESLFGSPLDRAARTEEEAILDECLNELSTDHREVIVLRDFAGGSWEWIAEKLGRPTERAAQELHHRAVMALGRKASPRLPH